MADAERFDLGDVRIAVTRKDIRNVHLAVHPPDGTVTLTAPLHTRLDAARAYAITRLPWIRKQRAQLAAQARETPRRYVTRESHYLWGERYLLRVEEADAKPQVRLSPKHITLRVRPGSDRDARAGVVHAWHKRLLYDEVPSVLEEWSSKMGLPVPRYFLQRMKTKWGSCNPAAGTIRLNTELVKKPRHMLTYVIAHELAHFIEPNHSEAFAAVLDRYYPQWRLAREELNALPLGVE